ncbi:hypothetical protein [uncultured Bilophila sp.]|uniref:hypothetical protein n=1 Tax=uncultured Bilophila sp. TaxID=529385 RepID=UPI00266EF400|nr:hypothetical protein [uncultured Bilophila sp.]
MYIAIKYIGKKYTPGEILPDNLPADEVKWLLEAGAIRKAAPAPGRPAVPEETEEPKTPAAPDDEQEPETTEEEPLDEEPEDEIDEEAEAPEIDVMDGLVTAPAEEEKPARTAARKSAGKAAKGGKSK